PGCHGWRRCCGGSRSTGARVPSCAPAPRASCPSPTRRRPCARPWWPPYLRGLTPPSLPRRRTAGHRLVSQRRPVRPRPRDGTVRGGHPFLGVRTVLLGRGARLVEVGEGLLALLEVPPQLLDACGHVKDLGLHPREVLLRLGQVVPCLPGDALLCPQVPFRPAQLPCRRGARPYRGARRRRFVGRRCLVGRRC